MRWKAVVLLMTTGATLLILTTRVEACSCGRVVYPRMPNQKLVRAKVDTAVRQAAGIFSGEVLAIGSEQVESGGFETWAEIRFKVKESWKGEIVPEVSIWTPVGCCGCNYTFKVGRRYVVYAYRVQGGKLRTDSCTRTNILKDAQEDRRILGRGYVIAE